LKQLSAKTSLAKRMGKQETTNPMEALQQIKLFQYLFEEQ
jgi:hypothetical protein